MPTPVKTHSTTILTVRHRGVVAMGGDGQVTVNNTIMKADVTKIRRLMDGRVMTGFAGATADAFALLERFEAKLKDFPANVPRAATELAKEWRTDRVLRRLEAMMAVAHARETVLLVDHTKFQAAALFPIIEWGKIGHIVTDLPPTPEWEEFLARQEIQVHFPNTTDIADIKETPESERRHTVPAPHLTT